MCIRDRFESLPEEKQYKGGRTVDELLQDMAEGKTLDDLLNHPGGNLTYQDYTSDIREILAYNRTQHKDIMLSLIHI